MTIEETTSPDDPKAAPSARQTPARELPGQRPATAPINEDIVGQIEALIREENYIPGAKLPTEKVLAQRFGVSRNTVRSALHTLSFLGVVETRRGSGAYVSASGERIFDAALRFVLLLDRPTLMELSEAREVLEIHLAGRAAERRTEQDLAAIEAAQAEVKAISQIAPASEQEHEANRRFHKAIAAAAHNPVLERMLGGILDRRDACVEAIRPPYAHQFALCNETHELIVDAIRRQSSDDARRAMGLEMAIALESIRYVQAQARQPQNL